MKIFISRVYGIVGTAYAAQQDLAQIGEQMGFLDMGIYCYPAKTDSPRELATRIDGITAGLEANDVVILQLPTWNDAVFEQRLITRIKSIHSIKLIIFIHDVLALQFHASEEDLRKIVELYNEADLLIVPSTPMLELLRQHGLRQDQKYLVQEIMDHPSKVTLHQPAFAKKFYYSGSTRSCDFLKDWIYDTPVELFSKEPLAPSNAQIHWNGFVNDHELQLELSKGGFGLLWGGHDLGKYYTLNQPHKFGTYMAAGIPVIAQDNFAIAPFIREHRLGYTVKTLADACDIVQSLTSSDYQTLLQHVKPVSQLTRDGYFTKKIFINAIHNVLL